MKTLAILFLLVCLTACAPVSAASPTITPIFVPSATARPQAIQTEAADYPPRLNLATGPEVFTREEVTAVYIYNLNPDGERVFSYLEEIPAGQLIKTAVCVNGWAQVEYQPDPVNRPGAWRIGWAKLECE